ERAEATQIDPLALGEPIRDGFDQRVDRDLYLLSRQVLLLRDDVDQISLLHGLGVLLGVVFYRGYGDQRSRFALTPLKIVRPLRKGQEDPGAGPGGRPAQMKV